MKTKIILIILTFILSQNISQNLFAQGLEIFDIDTTNYPTIKAKFYAYDKDGKIQRPTKDQLKIFENGTERQILEVSCPEEEPKSLSIAVMVDTYRFIDLARKGTEKLVDMLNLSTDQIGITYMDGRALIYQDFTNDKVQSIEKAKTIPNAPGVQVDKMFNTPYTGGIPFVKDKATQSKILVLVSDLHCPNLNLNEEKLIKEANDNNIQIFTILLGTTDYSGLFKRLANRTNGKVFENVTSEEQITNDFNRIVKPINFEPCKIIWESGYYCFTKYINLEFELENFKSYQNYFQSSNSIAKLSVTPNFISFGEVEPGKYKDTTITLTAINTDFIINEIKFKYGSKFYEVLNTDFPITILQNTSKEITIRCTPLDSNMNYTLFEIYNNTCPFYISLNSGFFTKKIKQNTLKITSPNGGEYFIAGKDSIITWEGISPTDTCKLEFSNDNGLNWKTLTNEATNLKYEWKDIPLPTSKECLIKITQNFQNESNDLNYTVPKIISQNTYGGSKNEYLRTMFESNDGFLVLTGSSNSTDKDIKINKGESDFLIMKIYPKDGSIIWQKTYGGSAEDIAYYGIESSDGSYIIVGSTKSLDGDVEGINNFNEDFWIIKLNPIDGSIIWQAAHGGSREEVAYSIIEDNEGNYFVVGRANSEDGDLIEDGKANFDVWLTKINGDNGSIIWQKTYGGIYSEWANSIIKSSDGSILLAGYTESNDGDIKSREVNGNSYPYVWVIKVNQLNGSIIWEKTYGNLNSQIADKIIECKDGTFLITGRIVERSKSSEFYIYIIKINGDNGSKIWEKILGGNDADFANQTIETKDSTFVIAGYTRSINGDIKFSKGKTDAWIIKINQKDGSIIWEKTFGGTEDDGAYSIIENLDGSLTVGGFTNSSNGDVSEHKGEYDFWVFQLDITPLQTDISDNVFSIIVPEPVFEKLDIDMGAEVVGYGKDTMVTCVLSNKGEAPLHVLGVDVTSGDVDDFMVPRGAGDFILEPNECRDMMFAFEPTKVGKREAKITVRTTIGDYKDTITIKGIGVKPEFIVISDLINLGRSKVNQSKDSVQIAVIKNVSSAPIKITNIYQKGPNYVDFVNINEVKNATIQPNEDLKLDLRFKPTEKGRTSGTLFLEYDGLGSPLVVQLFGEGWEKTIAKMSFSTINIEEYQDAIIEFPINLTGLSDFEYSEIESIDLDLTFDNNILEPLEFTSQKINDNLSTITITNLKFEKINEPLNKIKFRVLEGSEASCEISLSNPKVNGGEANIKFKNGTFIRLNVCNKPNNNIENCKNIMRNIYPNPAEDKITIDLNPKELGFTEISIYENTGKKLKTIFSENIKELGTRKVTKLINDMPHGSYKLVFNSPNYTEKTTLVIMK